jgi:acyl-CoA thioesterase
MTLLTAPAIGTTAFDRTTAVRLDRTADAGDRTTFRAELDDGWSSLIGVHGGYMCAVVVGAAEAAVPDRAVRTMSTGFVRAGHVGAATVVVREVRRGRSISTVAADLLQDGELVTTARLTMAVEQDGPEWASAAAHRLPPPEACVPVDPPDHVPHFDQASALLDPASLPFTGGDRARIGGYIRPLEPRPVDAAWLAMAVDWFPPPAFVRVDPPTGGVSIDLTTHFHRIAPAVADGEWLSASFELDDSTGGLAVEHGRIADPGGTLLVESFHTRWTAQRRSER